MKFCAHLTPSAVQALRELGPAAKRRIQAAIELLQESPQTPSATRLVHGDGTQRVRIGSYRVIHQFEDDVLLIVTLVAGHRREIYR